MSLILKHAVCHFAILFLKIIKLITKLWMFQKISSESDYYLWSKFGSFWWSNCIPFNELYYKTEYHNEEQLIIFKHNWLIKYLSVTVLNQTIWIFLFSYIDLFWVNTFSLFFIKWKQFKRSNNQLVSFNKKKKILWAKIKKIKLLFICKNKKVYKTLEPAIEMLWICLLVISDFN